MKMMEGYQPHAMTPAERRLENVAVAMFLAGAAFASIAWYGAWILAK